MSKLSNILDDYLFRPARYLDEKGYAVHAGSIRNFFYDPSAKIMALTGTTLALVFAFAVGDDNKAKMALMTATAATLATYAGQRRFPSNVQYYFDTNPPYPQKMEAVVAADLEKDRDHVFLGETIRTLTLAPIYCVASHFFDPAVTGTVFSVYLAGAYTNTAGHAWRAQKALSGQWNVQNAYPEPELPPMKRPRLPNYFPAP